MDRIEELLLYKSDLEKSKHNLKRSPWEHPKVTIPHHVYYCMHMVDANAPLFTKTFRPRSKDTFIQ